MIPQRLCVKNQRVLLRVAELSDHNGVLEFLRKNFYPIEQSSHGRVSKRQSPEDEQIEMKSIDSGASVLAFTDDGRGELIGVSLARRFCENECRENLKRLKKISSLRGYPNDLEGIIFVEELKIRAKICQRFNVNAALYLALTSVRRDFQGFSLGKTFMQKRLECGLHLGFNVAFGLTVTGAGAKMTDSSDFLTIYKIKFVNYQDYRGLFVYNHFPPEETATVVMKYIGCGRCGNKQQ